MSFKDAKYFSEICLDIASSLQSEDGRDTCIAQDEVLQCCDKLYMAKQITQNQLLYLRHLVLIRTESIWDIHDNYSATEDFQGMSQALHQLANAHHSTTLQQEESEEGFEGDSEDDEDEINGKQTFGPSATSDANESKTILKQMVDYLYQSGEISENECRTLLEMIANDNEYCLAAFEVWGNNKNLEDFEDTLKRCAKLEIRKQQALSKEEQKKKTQRQQQYDESSEESSENSGGGYDNDEEDGESAEEEDEPSPAEIKRANADLGVILASLGLTNQWEETVPMPFVSIVFIATHRNVLQLGQAKALCDLYQAQYDLVLAAWEAYNIDSDARELIDTLKRIVRELTFDESGNITMKNHPEDPAQNQLHPAPVHSQESSTSSNNVTATSVMENEDLDKTNEDVIAEGELEIYRAFALYHDY